MHIYIYIYICKCAYTIYLCIYLSNYLSICACIDIDKFIYIVVYKGPTSGMRVNDRCREWLALPPLARAQQYRRGGEGVDPELRADRERADAPQPTWVKGALCASVIFKQFLLFNMY